MVVEVVVGCVLSNSSYTVDCKDTHDYYILLCGKEADDDDDEGVQFY